MKHEIAAGFAMWLVAVGFAGSSAADNSSQDQPPTVDCESRIQVTGRAPPAGPDDLRVGEVFFAGLRHTGRTQRPSFFTPKPGKRFAVVKAPPVVDAGVEATLEVPARESGRFLYEVARDRGRNARGSAVRLEPCPRDAEVAGERVGPRTPFVGGILVTGPGCYRLRATFDDGKAVTRRARLGVETCG